MISINPIGGVNIIKNQQIFLPMRRGAHSSQVVWFRPPFDGFAGREIQMTYLPVNCSGYEVMCADSALLKSGLEIEVVPSLSRLKLIPDRDGQLIHVLSN
jgi:hypothetical protein